MSTGIISIGTSGLAVAQLGLVTTEHNIANASTPGFNRQRTIQSSNIAMLTGSGYVGQGAHVSTIERMYDSFLSGQVNRVQTTSSELEVYYSQISQIDNMLADATAGLSPALQDFFKGVQQVAANPSQLPSRQAMISSAQALISRYQSLESRVSEIADGVNAQITTAVASINSYASQIAGLNNAIVVAQASTGQPPNDLLDQRDQLVLELNKMIRVTTTTNRDGTFNVYIGNGQQLVTGTDTMTMTSMPSVADPSRFVVGLKTLSGNQEMPESLIVGGQLGGLLSFRSQTLDRVANDLGRNAVSLAQTFNAQNALGQDLLGQSIGQGSFVANFFNISQPTVIANGTNNATSAALVSATLMPPSIGGVYTLANVAGTYSLTRQADGTVWTGASLAALQAAVPASAGLSLTSAVVAPGSSTQISGAGAASANYYTNLTNSDYRLDHTGPGVNDFTMTRLTDNTQWTGSLASISASMSSTEGFSVSLDSGSFTIGDSFIIQPTRAGARNISVNAAVASDARLIAAAMPVRSSASSSNTGTGQISAGTTVNGFGTPAFPTTGITATFNGTTNTVSLAGVPAGANISVSSGGSTVVYQGAAAIPYVSGAQYTVAGVSFSITGNPNGGDQFAIKPNLSGVSDGRNALALSQLQTQNTMSGSTASFQTAYAQLVSDVGNKSREISVKGEAQTALLKQATDGRDALSGVNLDEEAANLMRYQQAYQASAKMLDIGSKLFDTILAISN